MALDRPCTTLKEQHNVLTVGDQFPSFDLMACTSLESGKEFERIDPEWIKLNREKKGWLVVFA